MVRSVLMSVAISGLLIYGVFRLYGVYQDRLPIGITRVDIYADRITYRTNYYSTARLFGYGLQAAKVPPDVVALRDCQSHAEFEAVLDVIRAQGYSDFAIELPDDC